MESSGCSRAPRDRTHAGGVEKAAGIQVDDQPRAFHGRSERVLERGCARQIELALDSHHDAGVEPVDLDREVGDVSHVCRV